MTKFILYKLLDGSDDYTFHIDCYNNDFSSKITIHELQAQIIIYASNGNDRLLFCRGGYAKSPSFWKELQLDYSGIRKIESRESFKELFLIIVEILLSSFEYCVKYYRPIGFSFEEYIKYFENL